MAVLLCFLCFGRSRLGLLGEAFLEPARNIAVGLDAAELVEQLVTGVFVKDCVDVAGAACTIKTDDAAHAVAVAADRVAVACEEEQRQVRRKVALLFARAQRMNRSRKAEAVKIKLHFSSD